MTPAEMSALHHAAFEDTRGWSADEFTSLLSSRYTSALTQPHGFALTRTVAGESELLTLAVDPAHRRQGIAHSLLTDWLSTIAPTANCAFLEVAADNHAASALYAGFGFEIMATRPGYYTRGTATPVDALILKRDLTHGQTPESRP